MHQACSCTYQSLFYPYETTPQGPYDRMSSLERDYVSICIRYFNIRENMKCHTYSALTLRAVVCTSPTSTRCLNTSRTHTSLSLTPPEILSFRAPFLPRYLNRLRQSCATIQILLFLKIAMDTHRIRIATHQTHRRAPCSIHATITRLLISHHRITRLRTRTIILSLRLNSPNLHNSNHSYTHMGYARILDPKLITRSWSLQHPPHLTRNVPFSGSFGRTLLSNLTRTRTRL